MIPGFVRLSVTGEQRERFLNLCKSRGENRSDRRKRTSADNAGERFFSDRSSSEENGCTYSYPEKKRTCFFSAGVQTE